MTVRMPSSEYVLTNAGSSSPSSFLSSSVVSRRAIRSKLASTRTTPSSYPRCGRRARTQTRGLAVAPDGLDVLSVAFDLARVTSGLVLEDLFERGDARFLPEVLRADALDGALTS